jgi:hypothetical protein
MTTPTYTFSGKGEGLFLREKCNSFKTFNSTYTYRCGCGYEDNCNLSIINYENSIIGKKLLASSYNNNENLELSSDGLLNFNTYYYNIDNDNTYYIVVYVTGIHKKCKYSSYEIDHYVPSATNKRLLDNLKGKAKGADEFFKLLDSNSNLKKIYLKLKEK